VREIVVGEATEFVTSGLEPGGSVAVGAALFVFEERSPGGWIDDGVGAERKNSSDASAFLAALLVQRRRCRGLPVCCW
jgi:hypothetical protein